MICCLGGMHTVQAQVCKTVGNIITSVSSEFNGTVWGTRINWVKPAVLPGNATGYIIYEYLGGNDCTQEIARISNVNTTSYFVSGIAAKGYTIAINTTTDPEPITQQHAQPVITLPIRFDECTYDAVIHWSPYVGWPEVDTEYAVSVDVGNTGGYTVLVEHLSATSYVWHSVPTRVPVTILVQAINKKDNTAVSDAKPETTIFEFPRRPNYLTLDKLSDNSGSYTLDFMIDPATEFTVFEVQRATQGGNFATVYTFSDKTLATYTDIAGTGLFRYRIAAKNSCGNTVAGSNEVPNIRLQLEQNKNNWQLQWSTANAALITTYKLDRQQPNPLNLLMNSQATAYTDPIPPMITELSLLFCYAIEGETQDGALTASTNCVYYLPTVVMPDAVDPLSTVVNSQTGRARNQFGPIINANPKTYSYRLTILNRNGAVVADILKDLSDDPLDKSWIGNLKNENRSPEEVYTYHLSVTFEGGSQQTLTGTVVVVYSK